MSGKIPFASREKKLLFSKELQNLTKNSSLFKEGSSTIDTTSNFIDRQLFTVYVRAMIYRKEKQGILKMWPVLFARDRFVALKKNIGIFLLVMY